MSFASGLLDTTTFLAFTELGTTHMSGATLKAGFFFERARVVVVVVVFFLRVCLKFTPEPRPSVLGIFAAQGSTAAVAPNLGMVLSFLLGAILSGVATATPERKTPLTCARVVSLVMFRPSTFFRVHSTQP